MHFYKKSPDYSSGDLTQLKAACVCNNTLGILAVKNNFHKFIPAALIPKLNRFVEIMQRENFPTNVSNVSYLHNLR
jgi:dsRNA-specific ribonuclease